MNSVIKIVVLLFGLFNIALADDENILSRVSLDQATQQILNIANNKVLGATTEIIDGKEVHIIKVLESNGWIKFYKIDAETGAIIS